MAIFLKWFVAVEISIQIETPKHSDSDGKSEGPVVGGDLQWPLPMRARVIDSMPSLSDCPTFLTGPLTSPPCPQALSLTFLGYSFLPWKPRMALSISWGYVRSE